MDFKLTGVAHCLENTVAAHSIPAERWVSLSADPEGNPGDLSEYSCLKFKTLLKFDLPQITYLLPLYFFCDLCLFSSNLTCRVGNLTSNQIHNYKKGMTIIS